MTLLTAQERRILEAADDAFMSGVRPDELTDAVRRSLHQVPGVDFRAGVARLSERGLLCAQVRHKPGGEVGRVVIERVTPLGRTLIKRRGHRWPGLA